VLFFVTVRAGTVYRKIWRLVNNFCSHNKVDCSEIPIVLSNLLYHYFFIELWHILILWLAKMPKKCQNGEWTDRVLHSILLQFASELKWSRKMRLFSVFYFSFEISIACWLLSRPNLHIVSKLTTDIVAYRYCTEASNQKSKYAHRKIFFYKKSTEVTRHFLFVHSWCRLISVCVSVCLSVCLTCCIMLSSWWITKVYIIYQVKSCQLIFLSYWNREVQTKRNISHSVQLTSLK